MEKIETLADLEILVSKGDASLQKRYGKLDPEIQEKLVRAMQPFEDRSEGIAFRKKLGSDALFVLSDLTDLSVRLDKTLLEKYDTSGVIGAPLPPAGTDSEQATNNLHKKWGERAGRNPEEILPGQDKGGRRY